MSKMDEEIQVLRQQGQTYRAIAKLYSINPGKAWIVCNRPQHNENSAESRKRWLARGGKALCNL